MKRYVREVWQGLSHPLAEVRLLPQCYLVAKGKFADFVLTRGSFGKCEAGIHGASYRPIRERFELRHFAGQNARGRAGRSQIDKSILF